jgi:hypothetical protein
LRKINFLGNVFHELIEEFWLGKRIGGVLSEIVSSVFLLR